jgi:hypothetical protein
MELAGRFQENFLQISRNLNIFTKLQTVQKCLYRGHSQTQQATQPRDPIKNFSIKLHNFSIISSIFRFIFALKFRKFKQKSDVNFKSKSSLIRARKISQGISKENKMMFWFLLINDFLLELREIRRYSKRSI